VTAGNSVYAVTGFGGPNGGGTVFRLVLAPVINTQPQDQTVAPNSTANFSVDAADEFPLSYQWYFNTNTLLAGQTARPLSLTGVTNGNAGTYTVVVSDNAGSVTSSPAMLTVSSAATVPTSPGSRKASRAPTAIPPASPSPHQQCGRADLSMVFQHQHAAQRPDRQHAHSLRRDQWHAGAYTVVVGNSVGSVTSSPAVLTVLSLPNITGQPQSLTRTNGNSASFTVAATSNAGGPTYQWYFKHQHPAQRPDRQHAHSLRRDQWQRRRLHRGRG